VETELKLTLKKPRMESCGGLTERVFRAWKEPNSHKNLHTNKIDVKEIDGNSVHHK
jgi:hypothetical protein